MRRDVFQEIADLTQRTWEGGEGTFKLEEQGDQVKLTLTHSNLPSDKDRRFGILAGWHTYLDILVD